MRYSPAGTRVRHQGGVGGCRTTPPLNFKDLNALQSCVHKARKSSGLRLLTISTSVTQRLSIHKSDVLKDASNYCEAWRIEVVLDVCIATEKWVHAAIRS